MIWVDVKFADTLLNEQSIDDECNHYCLVMTKKFGWMKAMYASSEWYSSYTSKITVEVTHFMIIGEASNSHTKHFFTSPCGLKSDDVNTVTHCGGFNCGPCNKHISDD